MYRNVLLAALILAVGMGCAPSVPQYIAHAIAPKEPETLKKRMDAYNRAHPQIGGDLGYQQMMQNLGGYKHPVTKGNPKPTPPIVWTAKSGRAS